MSLELLYPTVESVSEELCRVSSLSAEPLVSTLDAIEMARIAGRALTVIRALEAQLEIANKMIEPERKA